MIYVIVLLLLLSSIAVICLEVFSSYNYYQATWEGIIIVASVLPFILVISVIQRYSHANRVFGLPNFSTVILFSFLSLLLFYIVAPSVFENSSIYITYIWFTILPRTAITFLFFLIVTALFWIDRERIMVQRIQQFAVEKERESNQLELNSIQQQFKPHFLFNSLNSISALSIINPEEARKMIVLLSEFMRKAVKEGNSELISIEEEILHIQRYTEIEKIRFGDRLTIDYDIDYDTRNTKVPELILQPIIENAIKYGLYGQFGNVTITIQLSMVSGALQIVVENPFDEESQQSSQGTGYGLRSIEKKLLLLYRRGNLLSTSDENGTYKTQLIIPQL